MKNDFQSFAEAFAEASKKQNKEYAEFDNKKAMLDQVRRQFRSFLDALSIEYTSFKNPNDTSGFAEIVDKEKNPSRDKKISLASEYIEYCKGVPYSFNEDGFNFVVDFICNWKSAEYKKMRRREFSIENKSVYQKIIAAVKANMKALDYSEDVILKQECKFWSNIAEYSQHDRIDFLNMTSLLWNDNPERKPMKLSVQEEDDLTYVNDIICKDYAKFQEKWIERIDKMLQMRRHCSDAVSLSPIDEDYIEQFLNDISQITPPDDATASNLSLKSQKQADEIDAEILENISELVIRTIYCNKDIRLPKIIGSMELYQRLISDENENTSQTSNT